MESSRAFAFRRFEPSGACDRIDRVVAREVPIAIEFDGIGYAVMMATPTDLDEFVMGFALAERVIADPSEILGVDRHDPAGGGIIVRVALTPAAGSRVADRVRHRVAESSCGLCGLANLEQVLRPLPRLPDSPAINEAALFAALGALRAHQPLNAATGAAHAAALCGADGTIRLVREDVGRHNAFDKLIGAMRRGAIGWNGGFALLSSRCSYELVEKAVLAGCPTLVTVSAPTGLAIERAAEAGLRLIALARADAALEATPQPR